MGRNEISPFERREFQLGLANPILINFDCRELHLKLKIENGIKIKDCNYSSTGTSRRHSISEGCFEPKFDEECIQRRCGRLVFVSSVSRRVANFKMKIINMIFVALSSFEGCFM